jgi:Sec-independent protein translocase protein TatA
LKGELEDLREIVSSSQRFAGEARNAQREAKNNEDYEQAHKELQLYLNQIRRLEVEILARTKATKAWEEAYKQLCGKEMQDGFPPPWRPSDHVN